MGNIIQTTGPYLICILILQLTDEIGYTPSMKKLETLMKFQHYKLKEIMHTQTNQILELEYLTIHYNCCNVKSRDSMAAIRALWCCN